MADGLNPIVQRMIDAGESEENIATVIKHYKSQTAKPVSDSEPGTFAGGFFKSLKDQFTSAAGPVPVAGEMPFAHATSQRVQEAMNTPLARPTGVDAIDGFLSPAGIAMTGIAAGGALAGSPAARRITGRSLRMVGDIDLTHPLRSTIGAAGEALERSAAPAPAPVATTPEPAQVDLSRPVQAGSLSQADIGNRVAAVKANGGLPAETQAQMPKIRGTLRMGPQATPAAAEPAAMPESWKPFAEPQAEPSPMQGPRVQVGAEKVGRSAGLTKEQVRQETGPIVGETRGEASPILPEEPLKRIIDTLKALPKGGPEREAYVQRATSGKARGQVENIRRTLEHLGLIVPVALAGGAALKDSILSRMSKQTEDSQGR